MERLFLCAFSVACVVGAVVLVGHEFNEIVGPIWRRFCRRRQFSAVALLEGMAVLSVAFGLTRMATLATGRISVVVIAWPAAMLLALLAVLACETIGGEAAALLRRHAPSHRLRSGPADPLGPQVFAVRRRRGDAFAVQRSTSGRATSAPRTTTAP